MILLSDKLSVHRYSAFLSVLVGIVSRVSRMELPLPALEYFQETDRPVRLDMIPSGAFVTFFADFQITSFDFLMYTDKHR